MAKKKDNLYTKDSIQSLPPREFTRLKPNVYCGSTAYSTQLLVEIVSNAVDEAVLGHGSKIEITSKDGKTTCRDYGQGFLINEKREDGKTILEASFSVLNTSGKYREDGVYDGVSLGNFGIGSKLQCFLSSRSIVTSYRDGKYETIQFKDGIFESREVGKTNEPNGTYVEWYPDKQFFDSVDVENGKIIPYLKTLTCLIEGLEISYNGEVYKAKNGLNDLADEFVKDGELLDNRFILNHSSGKNKLNLILTYTTNYSLTMVPYVNTGLTERGPHMAQIKAIITRQFNKFFRQEGWLKEKDENLSGDDIQEGMYIVFNLTTSGVTYDAQVKSTVTRLDMTPFSAVLSDALDEWLMINKKEIKTIADKAINARKAREAARKARDAARNQKPKTRKEKMLDMPTKLVDCWSKDRSKCELFIVEGDSAAGPLVSGRDSEFTAIFPVRGKIISSYKNSSDKVFANQEVNNLVKALGLDLDIKSHRLNYDAKKLRYGRIFLAADADPDGAAIRNLLIELIWWLCPELITNGHVYTTIPPLFRITTKKNEYIYLKDANALEEYKTKFPNNSYIISRNKGLGESDPDELYDALLNPETRNVKMLQVVDPVETAKLIECLLGPSVPPRREYLLAHSEEANDND